MSHYEEDSYSMDELVEEVKTLRRVRNDLARENGELRAIVADLTGRNACLLKTLKRIEKWVGEFPSTNRFWDEEETLPMSYAAVHRSNGERDFMRNVAAQAFAESPAASLEAIRAQAKAEERKACAMIAAKFYSEYGISNGIAKAILESGDAGESAK